MAELRAPGRSRGPPVWLEDGAHTIGCVSLLAVLLLMTADVVSRTVLGKTLAIQFELTEMFLMPALATLSLARVQRLGGHLAIDFFDLAWTGRLAPVVVRLNTGLPAVFFALVAWQSGKYALAAWVRNDTNMGVIDWPMYLAYVSIPIGTGLVTLRLLAETLGGRPAIKQEVKEETERP